MSAPHITALETPVPCAACGRPTVRFNRLSGLPECGRDDALRPLVVDGFGPTLRGEHRNRWRPRRRGRLSRSA